MQVTDISGRPEFILGRYHAKSGSSRTMLGVPLLREGIAHRRHRAHAPHGAAFSEARSISPTTFADQAVIAIENVRLFDEVQARTRDLCEALEQQTATSEVLRVISSSPGELEPVFQAMLANAVRICEAKFGFLQLMKTARSAWRVYSPPPPVLRRSRSAD